MDLGQGLGNILFCLVIFLGIGYLFYLVIKVAVKHAILALLPNLKSESKEYIIEVIKKYEKDKER